MLNAEQKSFLLSVARQAIRQAVIGEEAPDLSTSDQVLTRLAGAFVTLKISGELRGCIGYVEGVMTLVQTVAQMAQAAALKDPRFTPITPAEVDAVEIEISVMSPLQPVDGIDGIVVGRDGLVITRGMRRGLLLPQVAGEWGWNREEFLSHTCMKAGLPEDAWRSDNVTIERFEAEVFSESQMAPPE